jgi:hypothetical protein
MAGPAYTDVVVLGVTAVDAAQQDGKRIRAFEHGNEMNMVGHQTEAEQPNASVG